MTGLEALGLLLGTTGPIQQLHESYISLRNRYHHCQTNEHETAATLHRGMGALSALQSLEASLQQPPQYSDLNQWRDMIQCLVRLKDVLEQATGGIRLVQGQQQRRKWIHRFARATITREEISKLQSTVEAVEDKLTTFQCMIGAVLYVLHITGNIRVRKGAPSTTPVATTNVPPLQDWVRLDFCSLSPCGTPFTIEGQLVYLLMRGAKGKCSRVVHQTVLHVTADSGSGKSCSVRGLVQHSAIVKMYLDSDRSENSGSEIAGGVHYFKLGADVKEAQIIDQLVAVVEKAGGWDIAKRIALSDDLFDAVYLVYSWFKNRSCLFIFDDALDNDPKGIQIALLLANLSRCSYSSAVLFTRRTKLLTDIGDHVHFKMTPTGTFAKKIFLTQAELTEEDIQDTLSVRILNKLLRICNGKISALNSSANCVRLLREMSKKSLGETLVVFLSRYEAKQEYEHYNQFDAEVSTHFRIISITLDILVESAKSTGPEYLTKIKTIFISLCAIPREEWVPHSTLQRYWGLQEKEEMEKICHHLNVGRLACAKTRQVTGRSIVSFGINDRVRAYCICEAQYMKVEELWSDRRSRYLGEVPVIIGNHELLPM